MATTDTTINPATGLAACCNDPQNRRTSTVDPAHVAKAVGGVPGVQICAVCGRKHYTFTVIPEERRRG
jgi:hypothetical protein